MSELAVAPSGRNQEPIVILKQAEQINHFHPPALGSGAFSGNVLMHRKSPDLPPNG
jgi:hypothetical protein